MYDFVLFHHVLSLDLFVQYARDLALWPHERTNEYLQIAHFLHVQAFQPFGLVVDGVRKVHDRG